MNASLLLMTSAMIAGAGCPSCGPTAPVAHTASYSAGCCDDDVGLLTRLRARLQLLRGGSDCCDPCGSAPAYHAPAPAPAPCCDSTPVHTSHFGSAGCCDSRPGLFARLRARFAPNDACGSIGPCCPPCTTGYPAATTWGSLSPSQPAPHAHETETESIDEPKKMPESKEPAKKPAEPKKLEPKQESNSAPSFENGLPSIPVLAPSSNSPF